MKAQQLSLFPTEQEKSVSNTKKAKLGRYERLQRELENNDDNLYKTYIDVQHPEKAFRQYNFMDLFSGAGGITQGLSESGFRPVISVEINPIASATHIRNFPNCHHFCGDIKEVKPREWSESIGSNPIHIVAGGPPCQGFSVAGKRDPNDPRNHLFHEFVGVVAEIKPWYIIMENVPGILTLKKGKLKQAIFDALESIGYSTSVAILESAAYKVPQIRPRAIFIANRFDLKNPYPQAQLLPEQYVSIESAISDLPEYSRIPEINHEWTRHSQKYMERIAKVPPGGSLYETYADAFKRQYLGKPSMTVKENHGGTHIHPYLNRVISAREMARLQTFPDSFIFEGSMKKAMWQIGNAVPPLLAKNIGYALIPYLNQIAASNN
ncbi:DNA cytosine methyltransferase [Lusitaniella coriacea]|uniref:DNA cytosine methyltransferase n=1 Tax=Lusitaniella coriacea TaxID=1983105 RepID=UPI003CF61168